MRIDCTDGRYCLYQWDLNQRLIIEEDVPVGTQVHFVAEAFPEDADAPVVASYEKDGVLYANVPNKYLQRAGKVTAYVYVDNMSDQHTAYACMLTVKPRKKPADYVYTETEVLSYKALSARVDELEKNGGGGDSGASGLVFDTAADMEAYIAENADTLEVGQDLFIREADVPDYWWDGTAAVPVETDLSGVKKELSELSSAITAKQPADLVVDFEQNAPYTADKTFAEVQAAYEAGVSIIAHQNGVQYEMYSYSIGEGFGFISSSAIDNYYQMLWLWYDDTVSYRRDTKPYPVTSVNGKTGAVKLTAADVGAATTEQLDELSGDVADKQPADFAVTVDHNNISDKSWRDVWTAREEGRRVYLDRLGLRYEYTGEGYDYSIFENRSGSQVNWAFLYDYTNVVEFSVVQMVEWDELTAAVENALSEAKESGEFDGAPGITPHIGENGNWYIGETDTGVAAQYVLTEADKTEIAQQAAELVDTALLAIIGEVE